MHRQLTKPTITTTGVLATLAMLLGFITTPTASAAESAPSTATGSAATTIRDSSKVVNLTSEQIAIANKYVIQVGAFYRFDSTAAAKRLNAATIAQVQGAVDQWNTNVEGKTSSTSSTLGVSAFSLPTATVSGPHGYITAHWWGLEIHFDSYIADKISAGLGVGAGIAEAVGLATSETAIGGIVGEAVAAALAVASGMVQLCKDQSGAVTYYKPITSPYAVSCLSSS